VAISGLIITVAGILLGIVLIAESHSSQEDLLSLIAASILVIGSLLISTLAWVTDEIVRAIKEKA
jgi:hypothetical protein